jgi:hypothetical protein
MSKTPKLRVARPTDDLESVAKFYREGLGFTELYRFADHDGFDGVMLGLPARPITWSSHVPTVIVRAERRQQTICWCSIYPTRPNGRRP